MSEVKKSNIDTLRAAFEKSKRGGGDFKFWKPIKYGKYTVRFLPPSKPNGIFYKEAAQHRIGDSYYFCPKADGDPCPICDLYHRLWDIKSNSSIALAKEIKPRKQYLYNIVVKDELGDEKNDPKVQVYMSGKILFETLMDYFFDADYGDLTDADSGYDFVINKQKGEMDFPTYKNSRPRAKSSPLAASDDAAETILAGVKDLDGEVDYKTYEELVKILDNFLTTQKADAAQFASTAGKQKVVESDDAPVEKKTAVVSDDNEDDADVAKLEADLLARLAE
jgi:hypothetical protein